jgi:toxin ParE1/3/4
MDYKLEFRPLATIETLEAYDRVRTAKRRAWQRLLEELDHFIQQLPANPNTHSFYEDNIRQGKVNRFPYVVVYEVFDTTIIIYSVFMAKQDTAKKRLK